MKLTDHQRDICEALDRAFAYDVASALPLQIDANCANRLRNGGIIQTSEGASWLTKQGRAALTKAAA